MRWLAVKLATQNNVQKLKRMRLETASIARPTSSCNGQGFSISSAVPVHTMKNSHSPLRPVLAGLFLTLAQIVVAVCLLAPPGPFSNRYSTLVQHDSYWFINIVNRGYETIVPPINHKAMEVSNVAFFPAYPALSALLRYGIGIETHNALLITAQAAAWGFWSYFFLFCERWGLSVTLQSLGALSIVAHPAAFFLIAAYSESLFLMMLLGFIYWTTVEGRRAKILAAVHGFVMSATRIVGIPCSVFPLVRSILATKSSSLRAPLAWFRQNVPALVLTLVSAAGAFVFFFYCQLRWGRWDMYMLTQSAGWGIIPDYLAVFKPSSYHWLIPNWNNPREASQMAMTLGAVLLLIIALCETIPAIWRRTNWQVRIGFYFCAAIIYFISVSGVASVAMESMLRYEFCVHALIVLAFLHFLRQFRAPALVRALGMAAVALGSAAGLTVQSWYIWNFTRGNWIA